MRGVLEIVFEIVLAIVGAVFFGSLAVALGALGIGCTVAGSCWGFSRWRRRDRRARDGK
jgi:hypothetical protein